MSKVIVPTIRDIVGVLTLREPWATLIALGEKWIETRDWRPRTTLQPGQWLAIHSGLGLDTDVQGKPPFTDALAGVPFFAHGSIVAVVRLHSFEPTFTALAMLPEYGARFEIAFGDYGSGRQAWIFDRVVPVRPFVPMTGGRGVRPLPRPVAAAVVAALGEPLERRAA